MLRKLRNRGVPRRASLDALLAYAWEETAFTTSDAVAVVQLSRSTTIEALDDLVLLGLLRELPNAREAGDYRHGRPARRFELNATAAVAVGVDAGRWHVVTSVADLRGNPLATQRISLGASADTGPERRRLLAEAVDATLAQAGRDRSDVLALCVGVPAPVSRGGTSPQHREGFWTRMNPALAELFAGWAPIVRVENDASLAAVAEQARGSGGGLPDMVTLLAGERLGAGVMVDGRLLRGAHGGVGELVVVRHVSGVSSAHGFGHQIAAWARELVDDGTLPQGHPFAALPAADVCAPMVFELAGSGDPYALGLVARTGREIARVAGILASLYDPTRIIVSGGIAAGIEPALHIARRILPDEVDLPAPELVASSLGADVVSVGAVAAALEAARDNALHIV